MTSIEDVADLTETITFRKKKFTLTPLTMSDFVGLLAQFPEVRAALEAQGKTLSPMTFIQMAPASVGTMIAIGNGERGNDKAVAKAAKWGAGDQLVFLTPILRMTMPQGIGPFVAGVMEMAMVLNPQSSQSGKDSGTSSLSQSLAALQVDTPEKKSGPIRLAS